MNQKSFTCRFCLVGEGKCVNLFDQDLLLNVNLRSWISLTFGLKINEADSLPKNVCLSCILIVYQTYFFIRRCQESEKALKKHFELCTCAESIISSSNNEGKSNLASDCESWSTTQGCSTSAAHTILQNKGNSGLSTKKEDMSVYSFPTDLKSEHLLSFNVEQNASINNKASSEASIKSFQSRQQKHIESSLFQNSGDINVDCRGNSSSTKLNDIAETESYYSYLEGLGNCLQNNHDSNLQLASENKECVWNLNEEFQPDSGEPDRIFSISNEVCFIEQSHDRVDKKSDFYLEFVKFLNSNVSQSDSLIDMCKKIEDAGLKKKMFEDLFNLLQCRGKEAKTEDGSHKIIKCKNPSSMIMEKVESNIPLTIDDCNKNSTLLPSSNSKVADYSKYTIKSESGNFDHVHLTSEEMVYSSSTMQIENNINSNRTLDRPDASLKEMGGVALDQSYEVPNDYRFNSHTGQCHSISSDKNCSSFENNTRASATNLHSSIQKTNDTFEGLKCKNGNGQQHNKGHSCIKEARIIKDTNYSNALCAVDGKVSKKKLLKPSFSYIKDYNLGCECSHASKSPSKEREHSLHAEEESYGFKELVPKLDAFSGPEYPSLFSPHRELYSHSDQSPPCILKESNGSRELKEVNENFSIGKNKTHYMNEITKCSRIINDNSRHPFQSMRHKITGNDLQPVSMIGINPHEKPSLGENSRVIEKKSILMMDGNFKVQEENALPFPHQIANEFQFLKHQCHFGKSTENTSTKKVANMKATSLDWNNKNISEKLHNYELLTSPIKNDPKGLTQNIVTHVTSLGIAQESTMLTNVSSFSKHVPFVNDGKNSFNSATELKNEKSVVNDRTITKKRKNITESIPRKGKVKKSLHNVHSLSFTFPCPICSKIFSQHELALKHLLAHTHANKAKPLVCYSESEISIPKPLVNLLEEDRSNIDQQEVHHSNKVCSLGAVQDEKIDEIRAIIQQHLMVNGNGSISSDTKSFRCPACFKLTPDWFEVTSHIVLEHDNLSCEWPMSFLFSPEIFHKLTDKYNDGLKPVSSIITPPQQGIPLLQSLNICELCNNQFSSKTALLKHLIWVHNKSLSDFNQ